MSFVHLHTHSCYSLLDGAIALDKLVAAAKSMDMPAVAISDHGNLFAALNFYQEALRQGIKPVIGCEVYVAPHSRFDKTERPGVPRYYHLVLLAKNEQGYQNLVALVSAGYTEGFYYRPRIDLGLLQKHHQGLIGLSACLQGEVPQMLLMGQMDKALEAAKRHAAIFEPESFFIELQDLGIPEQRKINPGLKEVADRLGLGLVATNDCHFLNREDFEAQDALVAIQTGRTLDDETRLALPVEAWYKPPRLMAELFAAYPEAISNSVLIAGKCDVTLKLDNFRFPKFDPAQKNNEADELLAQMARAGLEARMAAIKGYAVDEAAYKARLEGELDVLKQMGYADYFLVVADFINWAKRENIPVGPGRGSAAGSLVAYAMGITDLDPIRYGLIFERFLNIERKSMPDIDVDFCGIRRAEVIDYVTRRYGKDKVAQIITFGTMKARAAVRDVGRVMNMPYGEVDTIAKLIPETLGITLDAAIRLEPRLSERMRTEPKVNKLMQIAKILEGMPRHASVHAAGVVIGDTPLNEIVPLYKAVDKKGAEDTIVTQFDMKGVEKAGLIKFDFLGLNTLTEVNEAVRLIRGHHDPSFQLEEIPLDDPKSYDLLCRGDSTGVFQVESAGMKALLMKMRPSCLEDIIALVALYRPGPLESGMVDDFVACKHGRKEVKYFLPQLEPILKETYGVLVYQEQVLEIARVIAGYSLGEGDNLRRAMGKKDAKVMAAERSRFMEGAKTKGIDPDKAGALFDLIDKFAGYGFNKSHSAAYALIAYQTAYLKANYPLEFMAAVLTCRSASQDTVMKLIGECREHQLKVLPPDVNLSERAFTVDGDAIRFGLSAVKNVGDASIEAIATARGGAPFASLFDFCVRVEQNKLNRKVLESLIKCGAFDSLDNNRARLLAAADDALEYGQKVKREKDSGQINMFGGAGFVTPEPSLPSLKPWSEKDTLAFEKEALGFYITGHPLSRFAGHMARLGARGVESLGDMPDKAKVRLIGLPVKIKEQFTKKGDRMAFVQLEDLTGSVELILFPDSYAAAAPHLQSDEPLWLEGVLERDERNQKIRVNKALPLEQAAAALTAGVKINLREAGDEKLIELRQILAAHPGNCRVVLCMELPEKALVTLNLPQYRVNPEPALFKALEGRLGPVAEPILAL